MKPSNLSWKKSIEIVGSWIHNHFAEPGLVCKQYGVKLLIIVVAWLLLLINIIIR
jgi:hypothetical protein